jgi:hypothetical protein
MPGHKCGPYWILTSDLFRVRVPLQPFQVTITEPLTC